MIIKKFKNGNVNLKLERSDWFYYGMGSVSYEESIKLSNRIDLLDIDSIYDFMTSEDLYFNQINEYMYLIDCNTQNIYDFSDCYINILIYLRRLLYNEYINNKSLKLYPVSKKEYKSLMEDLENGC